MKNRSDEVQKKVEEANIVRITGLLLFFDIHLPLVSPCSSWLFYRDRKRRGERKAQGQGAAMSDLSELAWLLP